ncbi:hypothetical protein [Myceligenerans crystallogenes]|uniref:Uncharacterized protein n=1 Tax=Myceligenerans crystallogenes TaxID=316335 RepID=A0ABN2N8D6_9MICO
MDHDHTGPRRPLEEILDDLIEGQARLEKGQATIKKQLDGELLVIDKGLADHSQKLHWTGQKLNDRFDHVVGEIKELNTRFDKLDTKLDKVDQKRAAEHAALEHKIDATFEDMYGKFAAVNGRLDSMDAKFEAKFEAMDAKFEAKFEAMDAKFEARFQAVDTRFESVESKLDQILAHLAPSTN